LAKKLLRRAASGEKSTRRSAGSFDGYEKLASPRKRDLTAEEIKAKKLQYLASLENRAWEDRKLCQENIYLLRMEQENPDL
jgi:hypothetical protein